MRCQREFRFWAVFLNSFKLIKENTIATIPIYQKTQLGPSGSELPGGYREGVRWIETAGEPGQITQEAGKMVEKAFGQLGSIFEAQSNAQDELNYTKAVTEAKIQRDGIFNENKQKISDPLAFEQQTIKDIQNAHADIMSKYPMSPYAKQKLQEEFIKEGGNAQIQAKAASLEKQVSQGKATLDIAMDAETNSALAKQSTNQSMEARDDAIKNVNEAIDRIHAIGGLSDDNAAKLKLNYRDRISNLLFDQALVKDPIHIAKNVDAAIQAFGLTPEQAISAHARASSILNSEKNRLGSTVNNAMESAIRSGNINASVVDAVKQILPEEESKSVLDNLGNAQKLFKDYTSQFPNVSNNKIIELAQQKNPDNPDNNYKYTDEETYKRDQVNFHILADAAKDVITERAKDPALAVSINPSDGRPSIDPSLSREEQLNIRWQRQLDNGSDPHVLTVSEGEQFAQAFRNAPPSEKGQLIGQLKQQAGKWAGQTINELIKDYKLPQSISFYGEVTPQVETTLAATDNLTAAQMAEQASSKTRTAPHLIKQEFDKQFLKFAVGLPPNDFGQIRQFSEVFDKLGYAYMAQGESYRAAADHAYNSLFKGYVLQDTLLIPPKYAADAREIGKYKAYVQTEGIKNLDPYTGTLDKDLWFHKIATEGQWYANSDKTGMRLYDPDGVPVITKDGNLIEIKFSDIPALNKERWLIQSPHVNPQLKILNEMQKTLHEGSISVEVK